MRYLNMQFGGNTVIAYLILIGCVVGGWLGGTIVNRIVKGRLRALAARTETKLDDLVVGVIGGPVVLIGVVVGLSFGAKFVHGGVAGSVHQVYGALVYWVEAWILFRLIDGLAEHYLKPLLARTETKVDDVLVPVGLRAVKVAIGVFVGLLALERFGYGVAPVINFLLYFGLMLSFAAALSAIWLLRSVVGGLVLLFNKPFAEGDTVSCGALTGKVEKIELHRTVLTTADGKRIVVPNHDFVTSPVTLVQVAPPAPRT